MYDKLLKPRQSFWITLYIWIKVWFITVVNTFPRTYFLFTYRLWHQTETVTVKTRNTKWSHSHCDIKSCCTCISYVAITCSLKIPFSYFHWLSVTHCCFSKLSSFIVSLAVFWWETSAASKERYGLRTSNKGGPEEKISTWKNRNDGRLGVKYRWTFLPPIREHKMQWGLQKKGYFENRRMCTRTCGVTIQEYFGWSQCMIFLCKVESPHDI